MTEDGIKLTKSAANLNALRDLMCDYNESQTNSVFSIIMQDDDVFNFYVANVDQLRILIYLFKQKCADSQKRVLDYLLTHPVFLTLVDDSDALLQMGRIFDSAPERMSIILHLSSNLAHARHVIPDNESLDVVLEQFKLNKKDFGMHIDEIDLHPDCASSTGNPGVQLQQSAYKSGATLFTHPFQVSTNSIPAVKHNEPSLLKPGSTYASNC